MRGKTGLLLAVLLVALTMVVVNCGGGGSSSTPSNTNTTIYSIGGTVTSSGTALQGVTMTLGGAGSAMAITDASGNFSFANLANGSYTVSPSKTGYTFNPSSSAQTVNSSNVMGVAFTATASTASTYSISGTVTSSGTGTQGVTMTLTSASTVTVTATTDASGNYSFTGLANGSYIITPSKTNYSFSPANSAQTITGVNVDELVRSQTA